MQGVLNWTRDIKCVGVNQLKGVTNEKENDL